MSFFDTVVPGSSTAFNWRPTHSHFFAASPASRTTTSILTNQLKEPLPLPTSGCIDGCIHAPGGPRRYRSSYSLKKDSILLSTELKRVSDYLPDGDLLHAN